MKIKKDSIEKIVLCILTFILIMYISIGLIIFSSFTISKKFLNSDNVYEFVNNIDIISIFKNELGTELKQFNIIEDELNEIGITTDSMNEFVNSEDVKDLGSDIITNMFDKISNNSNIDYKITNDQISELVENNIDKIETKSDISSEQLLNKIENKIPNLVLNINQILDKFYDELSNSETIQKYQNYIYKSINVLDIVYSDFVASLIIFVVSSFIILLIFIRKSLYKSLKWLSVSFIIPTIIFGLISTVIFSFNGIDNLLINSILDIVNKDLIKHSIIYFIISLIFVIINVVAYTIKKYKKQKKVSHE